jgi:hypothetical protein
MYVCGKYTLRQMNQLENMFFFQRGFAYSLSSHNSAMSNIEKVQNLTLVSIISGLVLPLSKTNFGSTFEVVPSTSANF